MRLAGRLNIEKLVLGGRFDEALLFARELHDGHERKETGVPYFSHLMAVAAIVMEYEGTEEAVIAALLHDSIEDRAKHFDGGAEGLRKVIEAKFGGKVLSIVEECTDTDEDPKPPWRERKEAFIAHLKTASEEGLLVSAADKLHNVRSIHRDLHGLGDSLWVIFAGKKDGTLWYYRSLVTAFQENLMAKKSLVDELDRMVSEIEKYAG